MTDEEWIDVSVAQDGGVMKKILKEAPDGASGPPPKGNEIEAHYTGTSRSDPIDLVEWLLLGIAEKLVCFNC